VPLELGSAVPLLLLLPGLVLEIVVIVSSQDSGLVSCLVVSGLFLCSEVRDQGR